MNKVTNVWVKDKMGGKFLEQMSERTENFNKDCAL